MRTLTHRTHPRTDLDPIGADVREVLRAFIARRVGDADTAEDLTQEVLLKAHRSGTDLDSLDDVGAWLYRIARNTLVDHFRWRDRHPSPAALHDDEDDLAEASDDQDVRHALAQCLLPLVEHLDPVYRQALTLTDLEGLTQPEAAGRAGISVSGMKSRVQRGRAQLREALLDCCAIQTDMGGRISGYSSRDSCHCAQSSQTSQENRT